MYFLKHLFCGYLINQFFIPIFRQRYRGYHVGQYLPQKIKCIKNKFEYGGTGEPIDALLSQPLINFSLLLLVRASITAKDHLSQDHVYKLTYFYDATYIKLA